MIREWGSAGVSEGERKKFSSVLLQKPEQFVKLMFAECLETGIAQDLLHLCASHINMACLVPECQSIWLVLFSFLFKKKNSFDLV